MASNPQLPPEDGISCQLSASFTKKLYLREDRADIHFVFDSKDGESIRIPAHKFLLTGLSDVFCAMFNGSWKENDEVKIVDRNEVKRIDSVPYRKRNKIYCNRRVSKFRSAKQHFIKEIETTTFSTNQTVLLTGFQCENIYQSKEILKAELPTELTIYEIPDPTQPHQKISLHNQKTTFKNLKGTTITLCRPLLIKSRPKYEMQFKQTPPNESYIKGLLKSEVSVDSEFTVKFYDDIPDDDNVSRGLVYNLCFVKI